jgi:hypothetical protein
LMATEAISHLFVFTPLLIGEHLHR